MRRRFLVYLPVLLAAAMLRTGFASDLPQAKEKVLWSGGDVGNVHSISPDGRMLAYIDRSQQPGVGIRDLSTGTSRVIAPGVVSPVGNGLRPALSESAAEVVFSGDGTQVAYSWAKHRQDVYEVRIADVREGGSTRLVAAMPAGAFIRLHDWSKDGKWIAIERSSSGAKPVLEFVILNVADGTSRVRKTTAGRGQLSRMAFSPDSRYLAYDRPANEKTVQHDVFVLPVEGTGAEKSGAAGTADESVAGWSPDGRYLLFTSEEGASINLRGQPMTNGSPDGPSRTLRSGLEGNPVGMTTAGALVMAVTADPTSIYGVEVNRQTGAVLSAPARLSTRRWATSWEPTFSRDGKRVAYLSSTSIGMGGPGRPRPFLSIKSLDTGQSTVLPLKLLGIMGYDWSPDERTLVAQATDLQGRYGIHLIDGSTGTTTPVAIANDNTRYVQPQWATVGRTVFYLKSPRGIRTGQLLARNLDTKEEREFMDGAPFRTNDGAVLGPAGTLSPDGLSVAIAAAQIWIASVKDKSLRPILQLPDGQFPFAGDLRWTGDGRAILISLREGVGRDASYHLWLAPIDGSKPVRLAINLPLQQLSPAVHPDGKQIAFVSGGAQTREIRLLENFLPPAQAPAASQTPRPTYESTTGPVIAFDEGHKNPPSPSTPALFELLRADGYRPRPLTQGLSAASLADVDVLFINCPGGLTALELARARRLPDAAAEAQAAALSDDEIAAVVAWLSAGGSVLLVVDHAPYPLAAAKLTAALGIGNWGGGAVRTDLCKDPGSKPGCMAPDPAGNPRAGNIFYWRKDYFPGGQPRLVEIPAEGGFKPSSGYQAADAVLARHPITDGRGSNERIQRVVVFGGSAFEAPPGAEPLLTLPASASAGTPQASIGRWVQGAVMRVGKGRLAVFADNAVVSGGTVGDNRQFVLNVMHWLSRAL